MGSHPYPTFDLDLSYIHPLLDAGYVYIAKPPLYQVKQGKRAIYLNTDGAQGVARKKI